MIAEAALFQWIVGIAIPVGIALAGAAVNAIMRQTRATSQNAQSSAVLAESVGGLKKEIGGLATSVIDLRTELHDTREHLSREVREIRERQIRVEAKMEGEQA